MWVRSRPCRRLRNASPRRRRDPVPERGAHVPFCLWCVCGAATLISVIYFHMCIADGGWWVFPRSRASAIRADRRTSIHIASSEPFCIVHRDPHRSILGRAWRAHALRGRCVGVRGSCLALSLESGYEDRVQIQIFEHSTPVVLNVVVASFAGGNDSELIWMDAIECLCVGVAPWLPPIVTTRQIPQAEPPWWTHRSELRRRIRQFLSAA